MEKEIGGIVELSKPVAYLDSNVVIEFCWDNFFSREIRPKRIAFRLFEEAAKGECEAIISEYTVLEVSQHFSNYYLLIKLLKNGYSYNEFKRERKEFTLTEDETKEIDEIVDFLRENESINYLEIERIEGVFFREVLPKYLKSCIELMDALHVDTAIQTNCTYFVTKDGELRVRIEEMKQKGQISSTLKVRTPSGFLKELKHSK